MQIDTDTSLISLFFPSKDKYAWTEKKKSDEFVYIMKAAHLVIKSSSVLSDAKSLIGIKTVADVLYDTEQSNT